MTPGAQDEDVRAAGPDGLQGDRGRLPGASQTDFDFVRQLIEQDRVPEDVTISVLTQAREDLIERTVQAWSASTTPTSTSTTRWPRCSAGSSSAASNDEIKDIAVRGTELVMKYAENLLDTTVIGYEYSPEIFTGTELPFSVEVCEAVSDVWQPDDGREIILNLPATVEMATPNVYADQIEWFSPAADPARVHHDQPAPAQRPRHGRRGDRAGR